MWARDRRVLLIGGAIAITYLAVRLVPRLSTAVSTLADQVQAQVGLVESARSQLARRDLLSDSLELLRDAVGGVPEHLMESRTPEAAAAELTSRITVALARHPVRVDLVRPVPDSVQAIPAATRAVATFAGDVRGVASAIRELERDPRIAIAGINIAATNPAAGDDSAEVLLVEVAVEGLFVVDENELSAADSTNSTGGSA